MRISTKGRYALNIMVDLAKNSSEDKYISLTEISKRLEISNKYLEQIISANMKTVNVLLLYVYVLYAIHHLLLIIMKKGLRLNAEEAKLFL